jgi:pimeloyl-ACP methyl ester carboxylesterase
VTAAERGGTVAEGSAQRDEVELAYEERGVGEPTLVFLHPWSGDRQFFDPQLERFGTTNRCLAIDLRGHGASAVPASGYSMAELADDVAAVCLARMVDAAVLIGHSMGGIVAVHVAARHPDLARGVVVLDSPLLPPAAFGELVPPLIEGMRGPTFREVTRSFQGQFVGFAEDEATRDALLDRLCAGEQHVKVATLEHIFGDDNESAVSACAVPLLYVGSGAGFADLDRLRAVAPHLQSEVVSGAGHFIQLEVPDQVNASIERFLVDLD